MIRADVLARLRGRTVAVIGDVMLDEFLIGRVDRISPEAPVPIVRFERREYRLGGAANVAHNVCSLGGHATLVGLVGDDAAGTALRAELASRGLSNAQLVIDRTRATTKKTRIVTTHNQQVARVDYEQDDAPSAEALAALRAAAIAAARAADAIILSDYRKGVVAPEVIAAVAGVARATGRPLLIDPKIADASHYRGATLLTPNHHEAELMTGISIRTSDDARRAAREIHARAQTSVLITWGEHGMWLFDASSTPAQDAEIPAAAREVADVTGAGDTVIATLALALSAAIPLKDAARLATLAAGIVVGRFGPATVSADELADAIAASPW
jgi:D-beta-D-heptose 7-phosphate kinase/D-beta-D-heptose 1-phosphate adenosyltransferase